MTLSRLSVAGLLLWWVYEQGRLRGIAEGGNAVFGSMLRAWNEADAMRSVNYAGNNPQSAAPRRGFFRRGRS